MSKDEKTLAPSRKGVRQRQRLDCHSTKRASEWRSRRREQIRDTPDHTRARYLPAVIWTAKTLAHLSLQAREDAAQLLVDTSTLFNFNLVSANNFNPFS